MKNKQELREELIDFLNNEIEGIYYTSELSWKFIPSLRERLKSINSASTESRNVKENEDDKEICDHQFRFFRSIVLKDSERCIKCLMLK